MNFKILIHQEREKEVDLKDIKIYSTCLKEILKSFSPSLPILTTDRKPKNAGLHAQHLWRPQCTVAGVTSALLATFVL
jgi:hypothetical protein